MGKPQEYPYSGYTTTSRRKTDRGVYIPPPPPADKYFTFDKYAKTETFTFYGTTPPPAKETGRIIPPTTPKILIDLTRRRNQPYAQFPINYLDVAHPISGLGRTLFSISDEPTSRLRKAAPIQWSSSGDVPAWVRSRRQKMRVTNPVRGQKATTEAVLGAYTMQRLKAQAGFDLSAGTMTQGRGKKGKRRKGIIMDFGFKGFG